MNSLKLTEGGLSGFSGAGPRDSGSGRAFLGGGGGTTNSSGTASDPSSVIPSNTGEDCPEKNCIMVMMCIMTRIENPDFLVSPNLIKPFSVVARLVHIIMQAVEQ